MRRQIFALTVVALAAGSSPHGPRTAAAQSPAAPSPGREVKGVEVDALDRKTDPCTDFYEFACGGWVAKNPLPPDRRSFGRMAQVQDRNFALLRRILDPSTLREPQGRPEQGRGATSSGSPRASSRGETPAGEADSDRKKASDYYAACMDEAKIDAAGLTAIAPDLRIIDELVNPDDLPVLVARLHAIGVPALFHFSAQSDVLGDPTQEIADVDQAGLSLPDRDYYLKSDARSAELRDRFTATMAKMFTLAGSPPDQAAADAKAVLSVETTLAEATLDRVRHRDPKNIFHTMTLNELQAMTPNFSWRKYAIAAEAPKFQALNVSVPDYLKAVDRLVGSSSTTADVKAYLRWHVIHRAADLLPKAFADADFDFFSRTLAGQQQAQPRWRRCVADTDAHLGEAVGKAFVEEAFGPQAKADTLKMVQDIKAAMLQDIDAAPWMSAETKKAAITKLNAVVDRIGYPDTWRDYSGLRIAQDEALANRQRAAAAERARDLAKIGQPVDRTEWAMTPPTVNAYYSADRNNINFPAGILQPPLYRAGRDAAVNYGAAGAVIGHELTHGFDDQGRKFDGQGNLRDWWTAADAKAYEERVSCIADQYSGYTVAGDTKINGRLTLGENTADNGGVRLALMAYLAGPGAKTKEKVDGFTPEQRLFIGYAQIQCENARPEAERLKAATNPHSSNRYRVNGPLSNMPEFARAFSCKPNAPMARPNACRVW